MNYPIHMIINLFQNLLDNEELKYLLLLNVSLQSKSFETSLSCIFLSSTIDYHTPYPTKNTYQTSLQSFCSVVIANPFIFHLRKNTMNF